MARKGKEMKGMAWHGKVKKFKAWQGKAWHVKARNIMACKGRYVMEWKGNA